MRTALAAATATLLATAISSGFVVAVAVASPAAAAGPRSTADTTPGATEPASARVLGAERASASARAAGTEHFRIMSTAATSRQLSVIATGEFTAGGTDIPGKNADTAIFPGGTLRIRHHSTVFTASFNPRTCLFTETQRGTYRLVRGTGRLAGISGSGRFAVHILGVFARDSSGSCTHLAAPATFQSVATFTGPISKG
jgi:hypothetical protein